MSASFAVEPHSLKTIQEGLITDQADMPVSEMIAVLREAGKDADNKDAYNFWKIFEVACRRAKPAEMQALTRIFEAVPADSYYKAKLFSALANAWMCREVPAQLPGRPEFPKPTAAIPSTPAGYPQDLRKAAERYLQVSTPFQSLAEDQKPGETSTDYQTHKPEYWKLASQLLAKKDGPFTEKFLAYRWGGWCCTGSDQFRDPQSDALLMALAADKRWADAAGAALGVTPSDEMRGALRVLSACVPDPEEVVVGGLAVIDLGPKDYRIEARRVTLLALLLCLPGDGRVEALTKLAALAPPDALTMYFKTLGKIVRPRPPPPPDKNGSIRWWFGGSWGSGDNLDTITAKPAGEGAQKAALDFLISQASTKLPIKAAETLARIFHEKRHRKSIPALRRLLDHPSMSVAKEASEALEYMGQKAEIPAKLGPVRYAVSVNGNPYANSKVNWSVKRGNTSTGSEVTTDAAGVAQIPRNHFLAGPVESVALRTASMASPADPWFCALLPAPPASDDSIPVEVKTSSLRVELPLPRPKAEIQTMEVVLWGLQDAESQKIGFWSPARFQLPVSESLDFKMLMPGVYRAEIRIPGATSWSGELRAGEAPTFTVPLQRASNVKFTVVPPKGWHVNVLLPELWKNGKQISADWDYEKQCFRGVSEGRYMLHLPSSEVVRKRVLGLLPDGPEFPGTDVPFEVGPDSPTEINLGEIRVKTADAGKRLLPGDYMTITFSNKNDQLDGCYSISSDGFVNMPFIGKVKAEGLSASDLTATLEREYDQQEIYKGLRIRVERMDKPPDIKPFLRDIEMLKQMESNPFWNKKGDFFTPKDRNQNPSP